MASSQHLFHLITQVHRTRKAAIAQQKALLKKHELGPLEWAILLSLHHTPVQSQAAIARSIGRAPSNVRYPVELLEKRGLVQREPDDSDRRVNLTILSLKGSNLVEKLLPTFEGLDQALLSGTSKKEQEELKQMLLKILENSRKG